MMLWQMDRRILYGFVGLIVYLVLTGDPLANLGSWQSFVARLGIGMFIVAVIGWVIWRKEE